jgi:murein DD-endopeptidase MepM/ murein hydrolase activator NlpD
LGKYRLRLAALLFSLVAVGTLTACGVEDPPTSDGVLITPIDTLSSPTVAVETLTTPVVPSNGTATNDLRGFIYPITGTCLPSGDQLMPNAPRVYRNGIHEGVDFYPGFSCAPIGGGTEVMAAKGGCVVRADINYTDLTLAELQVYSANPNTDEALDKYRGRQVWIDHGTCAARSGIVTRYAHLLSIAQGIVAGAMVEQGQLIAFVGESGTPESLTNPGHEYHLHFELRIGASYLGKDLPPAQVRVLYQTLFSP